MPKAKSKKQAALFGAVAGGAKIKGVEMTEKEAKKKLKGVKTKELPEKVKKKKK